MVLTIGRSFFLLQAAKERRPLAGFGCVRSPVALLSLEGPREVRAWDVGTFARTLKRH